MDFGEIIGTQRVDKSVDYRGFVTTGDIGVEDYAIGFAYARRINDKFALGFKMKRLHENLGRAFYVVMNMMILKLAERFEHEVKRSGL